MANKTQQSNTRSKVRWGIVGVLALFLIAGFFDAPALANKLIDSVNQTVSLGLPRVPEKDFNLGLDLQGGAHLIYQADISGIEANERGVAVEGVRDVIERRVNAIGVSEPNVQTTKVSGEYRIIVELPGISDTNNAINMIGETPILEFKEENNQPQRELTEVEEQEIVQYNMMATQRLGEAVEKIKSGADFGSVVREYSEDELSKNNGGYLGYIDKFSPYPALFSWAENAQEGEMGEFIQSVDGINIVKRGQERDGQLQVESSHILICYIGAQYCEEENLSKEEAFLKAQSIFNLVNADNFSELAEENSTDAGSAANGGYLGFVNKGMLVPEVDAPLFNAEVGQIIGPIESPFGYHVIYKQSESIGKEYEIWRLLIKTKSAEDILPPDDPWKSTGLSGKQLSKAEVVTDPQTGAVQVSLIFDGEGKDLFREITERNLNKPVAIFLDGVPISIPTVNSIIPDGRAVIQGNFNLKEAQLLAQRLNAGALPVPVELISQQSVGASLGAESLQKSLKAGIAGLIVIMIFMLIYYRLPGLVSVIALCLYIALALAIFKLIGVTLTLAGIAGLILSIGMAVDANVLIFERLKEELKQGKSLRTAVEEGFLRAWTSIRDGNISTLITCVLLIWFGSSFVQGFAVTLAIGILTSMFSAITVTRVILRFVVPWFGSGKSRLFLGSK